MESQFLIDRLRFIKAQEEEIKDTLHYGSAHYDVDVTVAIDTLQRDFKDLKEAFKAQLKEQLLVEALQKI